jgi:hypothetical protein
LLQFFSLPQVDLSQQLQNQLIISAAAKSARKITAKHDLPLKSADV